MLTDSDDESSDNTLCVISDSGATKSIHGNINVGALLPYYLAVSLRANHQSKALGPFNNSVLSDYSVLGLSPVTRIQSFSIASTFTFVKYLE
jgi:hypothetical protein